MTAVHAVQGVERAGPAREGLAPGAGDAGAFAPLLLQALDATRPPRPEPDGRPSSSPAPEGGGEEEPAPRAPAPGGTAPAQRPPRGQPRLRTAAIDAAHAAAAELRTRGEVRLETRRALETRLSGPAQAGDAAEPSGEPPSGPSEPPARERQRPSPVSSETGAAPRPGHPPAHKPAPDPPAPPPPPALPLPRDAATPPTSQPPAPARAVAGQSPAAAAPPVAQPTAAASPARSAPGAAAVKGPAPTPRPIVAPLDRAGGSAPRAPVRAGDAPRGAPRPAELDAAEQVHRGLAMVLRQRGGSLVLRLSPEALGPVRIRLDLEGGRVEAKFEAATDGARRLLESNLEGLKASLEARGLTVEKLEIGSLAGAPESRPAEPGHGHDAGGAGDEHAAPEDASRRQDGGGPRSGGPRPETGEAPAEPGGVGVGTCVVTRLGLDAVA